MHDADCDAGQPSIGLRPSCAIKNKKADVVEHFEMFHHVGLLFNGPPGKARLPFI
jgi:hypothetical protein